MGSLPCLISCLCRCAPQQAPCVDSWCSPQVADPEKGPLILKQEGWHFEATPSESSDGEPHLTFKGVVFNEMKVRGRCVGGACVGS